MPVDTQFSFSGGEVTPSLYGRGDLAKSDVACRTLKNFIVHPEGGASNRAGLYFTGAVHDSSRKVRLIPFRFNTTQTYVLEFSHQTLRIIKDNAYVMEPEVTITNISQANPCEVTIGSHSYVAGQELYIKDVVGMTELNGRFFRIRTTTATTITLEDIFGDAIDSTSFTAYSSGGTVEVVPVFTTVFDEDDLFSIKYTQDADTLTVTCPISTYTSMYNITRTAHHTWTVSAISFTPTVSAPTGLGVTRSPGTDTGMTRQYVVTAIDDDTGEESVASSSVSADHDLSKATTNTNDLSWTAVSGAERYNVYCDDLNSGVYGYIGVASSTTFEDNYIDPDYTKAPPETNNPFPGANDIPRCVTYHQQRRLYAGTANRPSTWHASRIGQYKNMNRSAIQQPDDAFSYNVLGNDVHEIRDMKSLRDLFLFTSSGVWSVATGENIAFTLDNIGANMQETWGVSNIPVLQVGNSMLYVQDGGRTVRDLQYTFESDDYSGDELTLLAKHIFKNRTIVDWAYARDPDSIIWCVLDDGTLASLTYLRKHQIWAWHRHDTDGEFESVCSIPETTYEYGVYFVVKRTVNGQTMRYVERMQNRNIDSIEDAFIVDSGLSYNGTPVTTVTGLYHLEGKTVSILADGGVETPAVVTNGSVTIPNAASKIHIGLPYVSDLENLGVDLTALNGYGDSTARRKYIPEVKIRVQNSAGLYIGTSEDTLEPYKPEAADAGEAAPLLNGVIAKAVGSDHGYDGKIFVRQTDPLPVTVLNIMPEVIVAPR